MKTFRTLLQRVLVLVLLVSLCTGQGLAMTPANRKIVINIPALKLTLYQDGEAVRSYPVGLGIERFPTPEGEYEVISKVIDPIFENPFSKPGRGRTIAAGNHNPLGTRWIGFLEANGGEYGIHGTYQDSSVGRFSSHGCVRMHIRDVEELFSLVDFQTPVEVVYDLVEVQKDPDGDEIQVSVYADILHRGRPSLGDLWKKIKTRYPNANVDEASLASALKSRYHSKTVVVAQDLPIPESEDPSDTVQVFKIRISN